MSGLEGIKGLIQKSAWNIFGTYLKFYLTAKIQKNQMNGLEDISGRTDVRDSLGLQRLHRETKKNQKFLMRGFSGKWVRTYVRTYGRDSLGLQRLRRETKKAPDTLIFSHLRLKMI